MNAILRIAFIGLATLALLIGGWLSMSSSMFIRPLSLTMDGGRYTYVRDTPFGDVLASWQAEITLIDRAGFECSGSGVATIQDQENDILAGDLGGWASACIDAGPPYIVRFQYQVWLFGIIPLRGVGISTKVETP